MFRADWRLPEQRVWCASVGTLGPRSSKKEKRGAVTIPGWRRASSSMQNPRVVRPKTSSRDAAQIRHLVCVSFRGCLYHTSFFFLFFTLIFLPLDPDLMVDLPCAVHWRGRVSTEPHADRRSPSSPPPLPGPTGLLHCPAGSATAHRG